MRISVADTSLDIYLEPIADTSLDIYLEAF